MKKLTAILLLILTVGILGVFYYFQPELFQLFKGNPFLLGNQKAQLTEQSGEINQEPSKLFDNVPPEDSIIIGQAFVISYLLLTTILAVLCLVDRTKKHIHSDKDFDDKVEELKAIQVKLDESDKLNQELKAELEKNQVVSEKINQLQQSLDEVEKIALERKNTLDSKESELSKIKEEAETLSSRAENLEKDNKGVKRELDRLNSQIKQSQTEKDELKVRLIELKEKFDQQTEEIKAAAANVKSGKEAIPPAAYQILYLLQKEGRLIDILNEDVSEVDDESLGGAVRPVLEGCAKLLKDRLIVEPVLKDEEGSIVTLEEADPEAIKLSGSVPASGPYKGELIHHGWRLKECNLPELVDGWKGNVIAPAEIEIS